MCGGFGGVGGWREGSGETTLVETKGGGKLGRGEERMAWTSSGGVEDEVEDRGSCVYS